MGFLMRNCDECLDMADLKRRNANLESQLHQEREKRKRSEVENTKLREVARAAGQIQYMVEHYIRCCGGSTNIDIAEEYKQAFIAAGYGGDE